MEFKDCPNCGSNRRLCESLVKELKEKGFADPNFVYHLTVHRGIVIDKRHEKEIPFGTELDEVNVTTDVCMDCGTIYATLIGTNKVRKTLNIGGKLPPPPQIHLS